MERRETMEHGHGDLGQRVEALARELEATRRELQRLRDRRHVSSAAAVAAIAAVVASFVGVTTTAQSGAAATGKVVAPFQVVDDKGTPLLEVTGTDGRARVHIGGTGGGVWLGTGNSGAGFLVVQRADQSDAITLGQPEGGTLGVRVLDTGGKGALAQLAIDPSGRSGSLVVNGASGRLFEATNSAGRASVHVGGKGGGVWLGVGASGAGFTTVQRADGTDAVGIGQLGGAPVGVRVLDASGNSPVAELAADAGNTGSLLVGGGAAAKPIFKVGAAVGAADARVTVGASNGSHGVRIADASGKEVAAMGEARVGGGVFVANDSSGTIRMLVSGTGQIHAADASGATRATMTSDGAFSIRNAGGTTVVRIGEGSAGAGVMQLADTGGNATVEAGTLPNGAGAVRAYPLGSPSAGLLGMPGTFIMGRK